MFSEGSKRQTIGFLSSWHVYEGASAEPYSHALMKGIRAAAEHFHCRLLLACGVGPLAAEQTGAPAWPVTENGSACFAPVGPWNTDGLIVLTTEFTPPQQTYVQSLRQRGFPIVFVGPGVEGMTVYNNNIDGIRQAVEHLAAHGHRQIAFIAGLRRDFGDSVQRLEGFKLAMTALGLEVKPELIAHGFHSFTGGQQAAREILDSGLPFTALVTSNDRSALGAISVLRECGKRVPDDVAVTGFDDILDARAYSPGLTTLRNDSFLLGYEAAIRLLEQIQGMGNLPSVSELPTPLIIRQSCGCLPAALRASASEPNPSPLTTAALAAGMRERVINEVQFSSRAAVDGQCRSLAEAYLESITPPSSRCFQNALDSILGQAEVQGDDLLAWNGAVAFLRAKLSRFLLDGNQKSHAEALLEVAHRTISDRARQVSAHREVQKSDLDNRLNMMTAQLLAALDFSQARTALDLHLSQIGVRRMLVALFRPDDSDPVAQSEVIYSFGFAQDLSGERFATRQFPPPGWFNPAGPLSLTLLPLAIPRRESGFVVFETQHMEPLAVIVRSLESALRTSLLYADAVQGRKMAEEADQMKSRFLSMVSHELRTPLNVIAGLSEVLLQQRDQPPGPDLWQDLERIYVNSQHLGRLIGDVLDLVSSGVGRLRLLHEPLDLTEVLRPVFATGEQMAREKGLAWSVRLPETESRPFVLGDQTRLRQVALNLINNAVKFTYRGSVSVFIDCSANNPGEVTVTVDDTGIGIPPEELHKLFTDFGQTDLSMQQGINGIGLGLAITRELVERQGGKIWAQSPGKTGSGSSFSFTLPTITPPEPKEVSLELAAAPRVLFLTHQSAADLTLAEELLSRGITLEVWNLKEKPNWQENLLANPIAALILDEAVALEQGWEIMAALKHRPSTTHLPVLVYALDQETDRGAVLHLDYQLKPLNADQISRVLDSHGICGPLSTILLVDDNAAIRAYHARLINQQILGCRILEAANGHQALEILSRVQPDLVLLDLVMPEVNGFTVLEEMRRRKATRDVPVIVLTAKMITDEDIARLNQSVAAVLSKGMFNGSEILQHMLNVLEKGSSLGNASQRLVRRAIAYIHAHFAESLTRDQIAEHVAISPDHLSDCFHQEMGITPIAYLNRYRITQARQMLEEGGRSITQVALKVGFSDSAHFSRVFQREAGVSPRSYQRSYHPR